MPEDKITVIHLSDLHFGSIISPLSPRLFFKKVATVLTRDIDNNGPTALAITGDIITKGEHLAYEEAARCIQDELLTRIRTDVILCCPGNHDITTREEPYFAHYNEFSFRLTGTSQQVFTSQRTVRHVSWENFHFLLVNSAYHGDHRRGEVRLEELKKFSDQVIPTNTIVLMHHSPLSSLYGGMALLNGYELLAWASQQQLMGILHGHIHTEQVLTFGSRPTTLFGVGSLMFKPTPNYNNQFAILTYSDTAGMSASIYRYLADRDDFVQIGVPKI